MGVALNTVMVHSVAPAVYAMVPTPKSIADKKSAREKSSRFTRRSTRISSLEEQAKHQMIRDTDESRSKR